MGRWPALLAVALLAAGCAGAGQRPPAALSLSYQAQVHALTCEAAALAMALGGRGVARSQDALMRAFGVDARPPLVNDDGSVQAWGDPYAAFVGDPDGSQGGLTGYGVYYPPVARAATGAGAAVLAAGEGIAAEQLYGLVAAGHPAVAWVAYSRGGDYSPRELTRYVAFDGRPVPFGPGFEHAVAVAAVRGDAVYVLNPEPEAGAQWLPKPVFEAAYANFGRMAVVVR